MTQLSSSVRMIGEVTLQNIQAYLFDLDGSVYFGDTIAPGALALVSWLRDSRKQVRFVTNNSRHSSAEIAHKLGGMGIEAAAGDIVTATDYMGRYVRERYGLRRVGVAGSPQLNLSLQAAGHEVVPLANHTELDAVVVGLDADFTYAKLERLSNAIKDGARFIAANADLSHPGESGRKVPETGALVAALEAVSGKRAEFLGKPEPHLFRYALESCGLMQEKAAMIGDNYDTDIIGGKKAGMFTIWLSGLTLSERQSVEDKSDADLIVHHLPELYQRLGGN
jgi:4-nitrophenyl phosphatase